MSKVLIADDDRVSCRMLGGLLAKWGYHPEIVYDGTEASRELMKPNAPQLAILDWMMPGLEGPEVIRAVRAARPEPYIYMLLLTSRGQKEDLLYGLDAGADDYLKKPFDPSELRARLRVGSRILGLERRLVSARETTEHQATHDLLTGVYNRDTIIELLSQEVSRCRNEGHKMSVLMADVDRFKAVNESHGHMVGDQLIKVLASKIASPLRPKDSVGRFGGEQFLILAPNCTLNLAMVTAERLRARIAVEKFVIGQCSITVTVSVGVTVIREEVTDARVALREAELALQKAKKNGRNRVEFYSTPGVTSSPASASTASA
jgi:diguanylate cyclase (GGDEF)-like protein